MFRGISQKTQKIFHAGKQGVFALFRGMLRAKYPRFSGMGVDKVFHLFLENQRCKKRKGN
jgi:hypothetical protein